MRPHPHDPTRPVILRIETDHGEATVIVHAGHVAYASPAMVWALGAWLPTMLHRLDARGWIVTHRHQG